MVVAVTPNSLVRLWCVRPDRASSMTFSRYSSGYGGLDFGILESSPNCGVDSTKGDQLHLVGLAHLHVRQGAAHAFDLPLDAPARRDAHGQPARVELLPRIHRVFGNRRTWLRGTHQGVSAKHPQAHLDEFTFRFDRPRTPMAVLQTLLGLGGHGRGTAFVGLTRTPHPAHGRHAAPARRPHDPPPG
jgi:hypothetical protein